MTTRMFFGSLLLTWMLFPLPALGCSVLFYVDASTGKGYWANLEDYWYDTKVQIEIQPGKKGKYARLWYGWKKFAQGGVNEHGLVFDGASTPEQPRPKGTRKPKGNLGDDLLAHCRTVDQALAYLEDKQVAVTNGHLMFADAENSAAVVEWVDGQRRITRLEPTTEANGADQTLLMTNFLLNKPQAGNHPCPRYKSIQQAAQAHQESGRPTDLLTVGNFLGRAAQSPTEWEKNRVGGTLYSTFLDLHAMKLFIVYQLDNDSVMEFDLKKEFAAGKQRKIRMKSY